MNAPRKTANDSLHRTALLRVEKVCDQFEHSLLNGETPAIEQYVMQVSETYRANLLRELLVIELHYLCRRGETPEFDVYRLRFPTYQEAVREIFENAQRWESQPAPSDEVAVTTGAQPTPTGGRTGRLRLRCPHCHEATEVFVDAPLTGVVCRVCGSQFSLVRDELETQSSESLASIAHFELISRLGVGGFATVWKAVDTKLDRTVAVKVPRSCQLDLVEERRFINEARAAAQLNHPHIVSVHEVGREGDTVYIVSDLVRGVTLSDWLTDALPTQRQAVTACAKIADALQHAHELGVVHRDLKPSNILLDLDGEPRITDFGMAKRETVETTIGLEGQIFGTPAFMSPEQARGEGHHADRRTDIYSLGVVLYQSLTGELPFRGNVSMLLQQVLRDEPPSPRRFNSHISRDLETICLKCMEKDPQHRYSTSRAVADDLRRTLGGEPITARPITPLARCGRWCARKPVAAAALGLLLFIALASPVVAMRERWHSVDRQRWIDIQRNLIQRLKHDLDRANSTEIPVQGYREYSQASVPRRKIMGLAFDHYQPYVEKLRAAEVDSHDAQLATLGLAILAREVCPAAEAIQWLREARDPLEVAAGNSENNTQQLAQLAFCYESLGQLHGNTSDLEAARENFTKAEKIWRGLHAQQPALSHFGALAENQFNRARLEYDSGNTEQALARLSVSDYSENLEGLLPRNATDLYRIACQLANCPPCLTLPEDVSVQARGAERDKLHGAASSFDPGVAPP